MIPIRKGLARQPNRLWQPTQSSIATGLTLLVNPGAGSLRNVVRGRFPESPVIYGAPRLAGTPGGVGTCAAANADFVSYEIPSASLGTAEFTFLVLITKVAAYSAGGTWVLNFGSRTSGGANLGLMNDFTDKFAMASGVSSGYWQGCSELSSSSIGSTDLYIGTWDSSRAGRLYKNGVLQSSYTDSVGNVTTTTVDSLGLNNRHGSGPANYNPNPVSVAAMWGRVLSAGEISFIGRNPWQLFASRITWMPASAATTVPTITAVYADSVTASSVTPRVTLDFA